MKLCFFFKNCLIVSTACRKSVRKRSLLGCKVDYSTACAPLVKKSVHLLINSRCGTLLVYFFAAREDYVLNRLLYRALVDRRVAYLADKCCVVEELRVNTKEHLACRTLSKHGCAGFGIHNRGLLTVALALAVVNRNGRTVDDISLLTNSDVHRTACHAARPAYSLFSFSNLGAALIAEAVKHIAYKCRYRALSRLVFALNDVNLIGKLKGFFGNSSEASDNNFLYNNRIVPFLKITFFREVAG